MPVKLCADAIIMHAKKGGEGVVGPVPVMPGPIVSLVAHGARPPIGLSPRYREFA